uniref:Ciliogenesis and planar polarity effector 2 n=1 Tax=Esox lucius TaxID=8010 RepID=A0AAY5L7Z1_ESOLU
MAQILDPGSIVVDDWHRSADSREFFSRILHKKKRRNFGLLEAPVMPPNVSVDTVHYKIFISGKSGVGKSVLAARLTGLKIPNMHYETTGIETSVVYWPVKLRESGRVLFFRLQLWDCGENALRRFDHLLPVGLEYHKLAHPYNNKMALNCTDSVILEKIYLIPIFLCVFQSCKEQVDAILFLFSFTDRVSFDDLTNQIARGTELCDRVVKLVVGTKFDLFTHTDVTEREVTRFQEVSGLPVFRMGGDVTNASNLGEVAPLLNCLAEHLWHQDCVAAMAPAIPTHPESAVYMKSTV